jgi:hypothetical protein
LTKIPVDTSPRTTSGQRRCSKKKQGEGGHVGRAQASAAGIPDRGKSLEFVEHPGRLSRSNRVIKYFERLSFNVGAFKKCSLRKEHGLPLRSLSAALKLPDVDVVRADAQAWN